MLFFVGCFCSSAKDLTSLKPLLISSSRGSWRPVGPTFSRGRAKLICLGHPWLRRPVGRVFGPGFRRRWGSGCCRQTARGFEYGRRARAETTREKNLLRGG